MPSVTPSRAPPAAPPRTLAEVESRLRSDEALDPRRRQEAVSALRTVARACQRELPDMRADVPWLRNQLKGITPAIAGVSDGRWSNVVSLTFFALKRAGAPTGSSYSRKRLSPAWAAVLDLATERRLRIGLSSFTRYCDYAGVMPDEVDDSVADGFQRQLEESALRKDPRKAHRQLCLTWNQAVDSVRGWPGRRLTVPSYSRAYIVPWETFPASLKVEVDKHLTWLGEDDPFGDRPFRALRPSSIRTRSIHLHEFASALVHRGHDPARLKSLADFVTPEIVKHGLRFFLDREAKMGAYAMAVMLVTVATHWVKADDAQLVELKKLRDFLAPKKRGMTDKNRERLRQFDDPVGVQKLINLPQTLVRKARGLDASDRSNALLVQTAVAVEILLMAPIRLNNLVNLEIGRHLVKSRHGNVLHLVIPAAEVKNAMDIEMILPSVSADLIETYIQKFRPALSGDIASSALFPGVSGAREKVGFSKQIIECVKRECGLVINVHLFRHIAGKLYLEAHPGAYGVIRQLHGHRSVNTTTRYYTGTETAASFRHYDEHMLGLRGASSPVACKPAKRTRAK